MDNEQFYRHCWLTLKKNKPRLRKFMDEIEFSVEGVGRIIKPKKPTDKESETKDGVIV